jgi:Lar family restriction alleviation protein
MITKQNLKPCPFCGNSSIETQVCMKDREGTPTNMVCADCGATGPWEYEEDGHSGKAISAWNNRTEPPK